MLEFLLCLLGALTIVGLLLTPDQMPTWAPYAVGLVVLATFIVVGELFRRYIAQQQTQQYEPDEHRDNAIG